MAHPAVLLTEIEYAIHRSVDTTMESNALYFKRGTARLSYFHMYWRTGPRYIGRQKYVTFQVAAVEIDEAHQGKGLFTRLIQNLRHRNFVGIKKPQTFDGLFFENCGPTLAGLLKTKFSSVVQVNDTDICPSFYLHNSGV